jgi:hypothetical protein
MNNSYWLKLPLELLDDVRFEEAGSALTTLFRMWRICYENPKYKKVGAIKAGAVDRHNATVKRHLAKLEDLGLIMPVEMRGKVYEWKLMYWSY